MNSPKNLDWRYEIKFTLNRSEAIDFERWLHHKPFFSKAFPSRKVNSVYFDDLSLSTAANNIMGLPNRMKVRVRSYGNRWGGCNPLAVELKLKQGRLGRKVSAPLDVDSEKLLAMSSDEIDRVLRPNIDISREIHRGVAFVPILSVGYKRQYYKGPNNIRVTVDDEVTFGNLFKCTNIANPELLNIDKKIVEFKFPPSAKADVCEVMKDLYLYPSRSSKYIMGLSRFRYVAHI